MSHGIKVKTDQEGKVVAFDFSELDFVNDSFDLKYIHKTIKHPQMLSIHHL